MKRKYGIVAIAALSTISFSQLVLADSYDFWTANTPKRAEATVAAPKAAPVESAAVGEEINEFTVVQPKRAEARTPPSLRSEPTRSDTTRTNSDDAFYYRHTGGIPPA